MKTALVILALFHGTLALAQEKSSVVARQGETKAPEVQEFRSPMELTVPVSWLGKLEKGGRRLGDQVRQFVCDDVLLEEFLVEKQPVRGKGPRARVPIKVAGTVYVRPSFDRLVDLEFSLMHGDVVVGMAKVNRIDAEEKKRRTFSTVLDAPLEAFQTAFEGEPEPTLKVSVVVSDNSW